MQSPIPESRAAEAAQLQSAVEQFLAAGGKAEIIPIGRSKDFNPIHAGPRDADGVRPPRKHPHPEIKAKAKPKPAGVMATRRAEWTPPVISMFRSGMNIKQIMVETGQGKGLIVGILNDAGIDTGANRFNRTDPRLVERAREMAADRYSVRYAAQILNTPEDPVSPTRLREIARRNGFKFNAGKN